MNDWCAAGQKSRMAIEAAAEKVHAEVRTQLSWMRRALDQDRDTLQRTLCFCSENTARAMLAATRQAQASAGDAWRGVPWAGPPARAAVWALGGTLGLVCRGVIATAVAFDVITNLARTEDVR